ncbi:cell wall teichoic acid glycosylation protein GtcA [Clostridium tagluense]|uniref:Cell wall teichoic acid glycosylation protein GtcA n=2 Tax=Clostridium tagluense TaxID=360422 RepID=A0A401UKH7_9CLOT|nr:cell wall teichoic acid glycosylation protein GtcA [Clostridium tagluense]
MGWKNIKTLDNIMNYILYGKLKHLTRFSLVGVANTLIDFLIFTLFNGFIGLNYIASQILGYSFGVVNSFVLNKKWTFSKSNSNKKTGNELFQFIVVNLFSLLITLITMNFLVKNLDINVYVAKIIITFIAQITNFLCYKLWVFN